MMKEERMNGPLTEYNKPFILQRADPYVYRHVDGSYYFTASVPEYDRIILRRADSLMGLKSAEEVTVWKCHLGTGAAFPGGKVVSVFCGRREGG
mgnify:CR=1 FL=1